MGCQQLNPNHCGSVRDPLVRGASFSARAKISLPFTIPLFPHRPPFDGAFTIVVGGGQSAQLAAFSHPQPFGLQKLSPPGGLRVVPRFRFPSRSLCDENPPLLPVGLISPTLPPLWHLFCLRTRPSNILFFKAAPCLFILPRFFSLELFSPGGGGWQSERASFHLRARQFLKVGLALLQESKKQMLVPDPRVYARVCF